MKKILLIILGIVGIIAVAGIIRFNFTNGGDVVVEQPVIVVPEKPISLCFYAETKTSRGLYDVSLLKMNLLKDRVTGEFRYVPAEKDSKTGEFEGTVGVVDQVAMARTADVWWNVMAEGMQSKEQLKIVFGEGTAQALFGEMIPDATGAYVYKDATKATYGVPMSDVACADVDDRLIVEQYIRTNIKTLAVGKAVLGGNWYVTNVHIDPQTKTGTMAYEDGHIQGSARFTYERNEQEVVLSNIVKVSK